jgi:hypothetical protein
MKTIVLKAIWNRYGNLSNLYNCMNECEDTVLVNLCDDINDEYTEHEILSMIQETI